MGKVKSKGTITSDMLQRIDNMDENNDFNPYKAVKKTHTNIGELFNDADYAIEDDDVGIVIDTEEIDKAKRASTIKACVIGFIMVIILSMLGYLLVISMS